LRPILIYNSDQFLFFLGCDANTSYSDSDIYLMQELQIVLEWLGTGLAGLLIFVVVLMITQLLHK